MKRNYSTDIDRGICEDQGMVAIDKLRREAQGKIKLAHTLILYIWFLNCEQIKFICFSHLLRDALLWQSSYQTNTDTQALSNWSILNLWVRAWGSSFYFKTPPASSNIQQGHLCHLSLLTSDAFHAGCVGRVVLQTCEPPADASVFLG